MLIIAGVLATSIPQFPLGNYVIYPFTILTTWFHEMGHGLMALMLGWDFERLVIYPGGSGIAESYAPHDAGRIGRALVAMGGPLGPSMVGAMLILATRKHSHWKPALLLLAGALVLSTLIWVRSAVGLVMLPLIAVALVALAFRGGAAWQRFGLQFLGVLGALSMFRDWDYLFSSHAMIGGQTMLSDTGAMAEALFLPHWVWAIVIIALSGLMVGASLKYALVEDGRAQGWA
ncbi:MAG: M50 family metallopeptidase [Sphingomonadaceae bacterium]|nr:M50 family metallopeptidase [Sphingomonadaceae bacterium]